tara:strand:- start:755 stop:1393 length:639 start_codon:yes stop_codon:yes gene_type:complete
MCTVSVGGSDETTTMTGGGTGQETSTDVDAGEPAEEIKTATLEVAEDVGDIPPRGENILNEANETITDFAEDPIGTTQSGATNLQGQVTEGTASFQEEASDMAGLVVESGEELWDFVSDPKGYLEEKEEQISATQDVYQDAFENTFGGGASMDESTGAGGTGASVAPPSLLTENDVNFALNSFQRRISPQIRDRRSTNLATRPTILAPRNMS